MCIFARAVDDFRSTLIIDSYFDFLCAAVVALIPFSYLVLWFMFLSVLGFSCACCAFSIDYFYS